MLCCGLCVLASAPVSLMLMEKKKNPDFLTNDGLVSLFLERHKDLFTPYGARIDQRKNFVQTQLGEPMSFLELFTGAWLTQKLPHRQHTSPPTCLT